MRSGWKSSSSSSFSPTPRKRIGTLATVRIDRAAPPRESPSSLVRMAPVNGRASPKWAALFTASCPVIESQTNRAVRPDWPWCHQRPQFIHQLVIDMQSTRSIEDHHVVGSGLRLTDGSIGKVEERLPLSWQRATGTPTEAPTWVSCSTAAARCRVCSNQQRTMTVLNQTLSQFAGGGRLTGTLQTAQHERSPVCP